MIKKTLSALGKIPESCYIIGGRVVTPHGDALGIAYMEDINFLNIMETLADSNFIPDDDILFFNNEEGGIVSQRNAEEGINE